MSRETPAEEIRTALVGAALTAYEDAGMRGLCAGGAWEVAVGAMRSLDLSGITSQPGRERSVSTPTCRVIRPGDSYVGQQGFTYVSGLTGATAGSTALCMTVLTLPDGARAKTHLHQGIETAVYVLEGEAEMYFGDRLEHLLHAHTGEYVFIPADTPHLVLNRSGASCRALVAHSGPDDQAGIVLLPHLDALVQDQA